MDVRYAPNAREVVAGVQALLRELQESDFHVRMSRDGGATIIMHLASEASFVLGFLAAKVLWIARPPNLTKEIVVAVLIENHLAGFGWLETRFVRAHGEDRMLSVLDHDDVVSHFAQDVGSGAKVS
jgi:hypothetical protein